MFAQLKPVERIRATYLVAERDGVRRPVVERIGVPDPEVERAVDRNPVVEKVGVHTMVVAY